MPRREKKELNFGLFDEVQVCDANQARTNLAEFVGVLCGHEVEFHKKGRYASVYLNHHTGTVLKVGDAMNNAGYLAYLKLARKHQNNPFFPRIYYASLFDDCSGESFFVVKLERLYEGRDFLKKRAHMPGWWRVSQFIQRCVLKERYDLPPFLGQQTPKSLMDYMFTLKVAFRENEFKWDLHEDNMMLREDGQLVITDPWA